jgi:hypothetical protein
VKTLTSRANIAVRGFVVLELVLAEEARLDRRTALRTRHIRLDPGLLAGLDILDLEITLVGDDVDRSDTEDLFRRLCRLRQQPSSGHSTKLCLAEPLASLAHVDDLVGDLLLDDQLVLHIDRDLSVVAHGNSCVRRHRAAVGIGQ